MTGTEYLDNYMKLSKAMKEADAALFDYCLERAKNAQPEEWKNSETEKPAYGEAVISLLGNGDLDKDEINIVALMDIASSLYWYSVVEDWFYAYEDTDWIPLDAEDD